jgi:PKHD-type hydroxylase
MIYMWQMWSGALSDSDVSNIIDASEQFPTQEANTGYDGERKDTEFRSSEIRWVGKRQVPWIAELLWTYAQEANRNAFGFDIDYIKDIQYTKYPAEISGRYGWHQDTFWANPTPYDRKLSVVVQLSDPSEYEGGQFEFDPNIESPLPEDLSRKGTIIVFPSFLQHQVTPVTKGLRRSLVSWIEGPKFR